MGAAPHGPCWPQTVYLRNFEATILSSGVCPIDAVEHNLKTSPVNK